ncbi:MAG: ATP-binding protein [Deltaproteobacteria bacterium]|nr:ATP-binding protein [Deltaproteobacteria bacterium]
MTSDAHLEREIEQNRQKMGDAALDTLVLQFANPFDFIRELVQNSLDAGTSAVDVRIDMEPVNHRDALCRISVRDFGEGMDEHIIDTKLTRLFSSSKENDLTRIGKFGIGFVSVFAIEPQAVIVTTARGGQSFEVFFDAKRRFEKTVLDDPFDGTEVVVLKKIQIEEFDTYALELRNRLDKWCKHAEREIYFTNAQQDSATNTHRQRRARRSARQSVNQPFEVDGFLPLHVKTANAEICLAFCEGKPFFGFYNRGLTLLESQDEETIGAYRRYLGNISFKLNSPFLEHTLTRDTLLQDSNFHKAMCKVVDAARIDLVGHLVSHMEKLACQPELTAQEQREYFRCLGLLYELPRALDPTFGFSEWLQDKTSSLVEKTAFWTSDLRLLEKSTDASRARIFRDLEGKGCTLAEVAQRVVIHERLLYLSPSHNPQMNELAKGGLMVLLSPTFDTGYDFFKSHIEMLHFGKTVRMLQKGAYPYETISLSSMAPHEQKLVDATMTLLRVCEAPIVEIVPVNLLGDSPLEMPLSGCVGAHDTVVVTREIGYMEKERVFWNIPGFCFQSLAQLFKTQPRLATLMAARQTILETVDHDWLRATSLDRCLQHLDGVELSHE